MYSTSTGYFQNNNFVAVHNTSQPFFQMTYNHIEFTNNPPDIRLVSIGLGHIFGLQPETKMQDLPTNLQEKNIAILKSMVGIFIGKMLVPLGWYPSCLTLQGAL